MGAKGSKKGKKQRSWLVRILRLIFFAHCIFWGIIAFFSLLYNFINPPITPLMLQRYLINGFDWQKRQFIELEHIPSTTVNMVIGVEDANYFKHFGFEFGEIKKARERNKKAGKIRFGASTISNQLARTIFLNTDRNYLRKYLEAQVTIIMEITLSKRRMLELYMNYVEWGKGIYGIETASLHYYGRSCKRISRDQSRKLVSILSSPIKYSPQTYHLSPSARQRYNMLVRYY